MRLKRQLFEHRFYEEKGGPSCVPCGGRVAGDRSLAAAYLGDDHQLDN